MAQSGVLFFSAAPLLALAVLAPAEEGKIYECTDPKGEIVYQGEPCPEAAPKPPPATKPKSSAPKPPASKPPTSKPPASKAQASKAQAPGVSPRTQVPPPSHGPVDARWATPEKALKTFVGAVTAGDRALILACLASSARADFGPDEHAIPLEKLKELVSSFTGYVAEGDVGPYWSIRAKRSGQRPKWILFERTGTGEWKITSI